MLHAADVRDIDNRSSVGRLNAPRHRSVLVERQGLAVRTHEPRGHALRRHLRRISVRCPPFVRGPGKCRRRSAASQASETSPRLCSQTIGRINGVSAAAVNVTPAIGRRGRPLRALRAQTQKVLRPGCRFEPKNRRRNRPPRRDSSETWPHFGGSCSIEGGACRRSDKRGGADLPACSDDAKQQVTQRRPTTSAGRRSATQRSLTFATRAPTRSDRRSYTTSFT